MRFNCPKCGKSIDIEGGGKGASFECPNCRANIKYSVEKIYAGKVLAGFELQEMLGVGGMGEVWLAYQRSMDRQVAIKILSPYLSNDKSFVDNFLTEVKLAAKLEHPNIVSAFDAGVEDGIYYLAMSYVPGETFAVRVARERKLPEHEILEIALRVSLALDYAWTKFKIVHRDVNPANIMLTPEGDIKLMDMGISKNMDEDEGEIEENLVGTPNYISPEQIRGQKRLDTRSDIYSLGATLYHLATGVVPFDGEDTYEVLNNQLNEQLTPVAVINPEISKPCARLIDQMVQKEREQRPKSWKSVIEKIEKIMGASGAVVTGGGTAVHEHHHKQVKVSKDHIKRLQDEQLHGLQRPQNRSALPLLVFLLALVALSAVLAIKVLEKRQKDRAENLQMEIDDAEALAEASTQPMPNAELEQTEDPREESSEAARLESIEAAWRHAQKLERDHPDRYAQIADEFERVRSLATGTLYAERAGSKVAEYRRMRQIELVMRELGIRANAHISSNDFERATRIYADYDGPFASETYERRMALAQRFRDRTVDSEDSLADFEEDSSDRDSLLSRVAVELWEANLDEVVAICNSIKQRPGLGEEDKQIAEDIKLYVEEIRSTDQYLYQALSSGAVEQLTVNDRGQMRSVGVKYENGQLLGELQQGRGYAYFPFTLRQIPVEEKYRLLEGLIDPVSRELYMGIYSVKRENYETALDHFSNTGDLSEYLLARTRQAAQKAEEERIENSVADLLRSHRLLGTDEDIDWENVISGANLSNLNRQAAEQVLQEMRELMESGRQTEFVQNNGADMEEFCRLLETIDFRNETGGESDGKTVLALDGDMNRLIQRARRSRGVPMRCNPTGRGSGVIPEVVGDKLNSNMILVLQKGDYSNRRITLSKKSNITIKTEDGVSACSIRLENCEDINFQSVELERIDVQGSRYVVVDSRISELNSSDSESLLHNTRITNLVASDRLTADHCLITSLAARGSKGIQVRNSILYGMLHEKHREDVKFVPVFRFMQDEIARIELKNCIIYTKAPIAALMSHRNRLFRPDRWDYDEVRLIHSRDRLKEMVDIESCQFEDPQFINPKEGDYSLKFNSPARKSSISGSRDLGPTPDLKPFPL